MSEKIKINLGSGERKYEGFINIDAEASTKPDILCDITKTPLPFATDSATTIYFLHGIEHVSMFYWNQVFNELRRVLIPGGILLLAYPEFDICVKNYLENKRGLRDFWRNTLYGRQLYPGDFHVTPVNSAELLVILQQVGFSDIRYAPDDAADYYTFMIAHKGVPFTREDVLRTELFRDMKRQDNSFKLL